MAGSSTAVRLRLTDRSRCFRRGFVL